jgi:hypothetical protein
MVPVIEESRPQGKYAGRRKTAGIQRGNVAVTTFETAAAWRKGKPIALALCAGLMAFGLAGCETGATLFGSSSETPTAAVANQPPASNQPAKIAIAPVIGPPKSVSAALQTQLSAALEKRNIRVAKTPQDKAPYTLRGYVVSAKEKSGAKTRVSYIWDVTDSTGKGVHRFTGEEVATSGKSADPWAAITPKVLETISAKTVGSVTAWLPTQAAAPAVASAAPLVKTASAKRSTAAALPPPTSGPVTGSINRTGSLSTVVPSIAGAPGDGGKSLRSALQRELQRSGVKLAAASSAQTYTVQGRVKMGPGKNGKQPITIDWDVKDPSGKKLGTVSQKNEVPQGSLDGAWGKTADAAAAAAAQGILKLLPKSKTASVN